MTGKPLVRRDPAFLTAQQMASDLQCAGKVLSRRKDLPRKRVVLRAGQCLPFVGFIVGFCTTNQ